MFYEKKRHDNHLGDVERILGANSAANTLLDLLDGRIVEAVAWCLVGVPGDDVLALLNCKAKRTSFNLSKRNESLRLVSLSGRETAYCQSRIGRARRIDACAGRC